MNVKCSSVVKKQTVLLTPPPLAFTYFSFKHFKSTLHYRTLIFQPSHLLTAPISEGAFLPLLASFPVKAA
ncbi:hypothetical protein OJAV_G00199900 [Oryzias javanicus]|uniref:Uncharacterized protein n=1 Tax=Oryzias javanicus TaxID=123683 RepID=A0A3S2PE77_ORYJA|nr:hypothetical protein OJAV_G00199900 [Oryzias javanicus]